MGAFVGVGGGGTVWRAKVMRWQSRAIRDSFRRFKCCGFNCRGFMCRGDYLLASLQQPRLPFTAWLVASGVWPGTPWNS